MGKTALLLNPSSFSELDKKQHGSQLTISFEFCDAKVPAKLLPVLPKFFISILRNKIHLRAARHGLMYTLTVMNAITSWEQGGKSTAFSHFRTLHWMASDTLGILETHDSFSGTPCLRLLCGVRAPSPVCWVYSHLPGILLFPSKDRPVSVLLSK